MLRIVSRFIEKNSLLSMREPIVVGLSGGADSVSLLAILVRLGYDCVALHCNFHLRGDESDRDEEFSRNFATSLDVPFHKIDFDTVGYASSHHLSIEMAARELRYSWFGKMREDLGAQAIAVAHHRDDSIETLLMNMLRGSGIRGMGGIRARNGYVVRPLLCVSREEILGWLESQGYSYVVDSTNLSDAYTRNFIRLRLLPLLEELNPAARTTLARTAEHLSAAGLIYQYVVDRAKRELILPDGTIPIERLLEYPAPETILFEILKDYGFSRTQSDDIFQSLAGEPGKMFYSPKYRMLKDREYLMLTPQEDRGRAPL
ncbi:tRNA(Ile)-lysidine synthetase [gut metagenome]|uniref:tRNA(Ile)-lysidine synthetase n=1 Tax=gut metagenome TaxID=749906 RepID=J9G8R5_9ZZZZ